MSEPFSDVLNALGQGRASVTIAKSGTASMAFIATELIRRGKSVVWVVQDRDETLAARGAVTLLTPECSSGGTDIPKGMGFSSWLSFPSCHPRTSGIQGWANRLSALYALKNGQETPCADGTFRLNEIRGVILPAEALLLRLPPTGFFDTREIIVSKGSDLPLHSLIGQLVEWGYGRVPMVTNPGEFAVRGDIVDILPPGADNPIRLDFFGDTIDDIRVFDANTQRSLRQAAQVLILPIIPYGCDDASVKSAMAHWSHLFEQGGLSENEYSGLKHLLDARSLTLLPGCASAESSEISAWLPPDAVWLLPPKEELENAIVLAHASWEEALTGAEYRDIPARLCLLDAETAVNACTIRPHAEAETLRIGIESKGIDLPERQIDSFQALFPQAAQQDRPWQAFIRETEVWHRDGRTVILTFSNAKNRDKFIRLAAQDGLIPLLRYAPGKPGLYALLGVFKGGRDVVWANTLILGEDVIQPNGGKSRRAPTGTFNGLDRYDSLKPGALMVHRDYGIARFGGLVRMEAGKVANDYLLLLYADEDKLYVPVDRISLVQRYKGGSELEPSLDRLGGTAWTVGKEKARKAIEKVAADLVEIYAWRKVAKGFSYRPVGDLYREFEASFGFVETPDQSKAIADILADMEKPEPMDRLICGDVGFGKTEVALRAAFRAASEGLQVALLCPTTVLAEQHYQTFRARLAPFALNVGLLSRFVSAAKQKDVLKAVGTGRIDVLIGTHRLLSKDVHIPNLGLLILDEEQRFGVRHKEKLKQLKKSVDALTLTATPIPRTLQLSISGVRELSVIETAPPERKPVATALIERDDRNLRDILEREITREGQVFWVHNRVQGLESVADYVRHLVPNARIGMAHGQLPESVLEETMHRFWHGELDVLVCTAIVESGLDFPRANTLIVDQPQLFGLGQLYQLRGRVGRSDRQAYAVFVVNDLDRLSKNVRERLRLILDLDYLGAGFQIAMEDLRLRGAGNILGEAQSGQMGRVGIELYLEMLEEAVRKLKGSGDTLVAETEINLGLNAHIPEKYISDGAERLRWYRRLSAAGDTAARRELEMELIDRYGKLPEELTVFLSMLELKAFLTETKAIHADLYDDRIRVTWNEKQRGFPVDALLAFLRAHTTTARFMPPATLECRLESALPVAERLDSIRRELGGLAPATHADR